jgi:membrane associated rhomboid family serine protease
MVLYLARCCVRHSFHRSKSGAYTDALALETASVASRPWTMLTYIFLHGSFAHLFYNMFALALFGSILERVIGGKRFLFVFFVSGILQE